MRKKSTAKRRPARKNTIPTTARPGAASYPIVMQFDEEYSSVAVWPDDVTPPESHTFDVETRGPWHTISKLRGLVVEPTHKYEEFRSYPKGAGVKVWGERTLLGANESGYAHEGRVNVDGKSFRAFTSTQMFRIRGKLVSIDTLHLVRRSAKK